MLTNRLNLPQPLVDAVLADEYDKGDADISVTGLIDVPRRMELIDRHPEIPEDVSQRIWALFGTAVHVVLERADLVPLLDRLFMEVDGWKVSGKTDRLALHADGPHLLQDWKVTTVNTVVSGNRVPEWTQQLNIYAHLLRLAGYDVGQLQAVALMRDWIQARAVAGSYPQVQVAVVDLPLWTPEQAQAFIEERVALHQDARNAPTYGLPLCSDEDRWARPDQWAVVKVGAKRALKLFQWEAEAHAYRNQKAPGSRIEKRPGLSMRCASYCKAASVCSQWAELKARAE